MQAATHKPFAGTAAAAFIALAVVVVIWGYNWVVMKVALQFAGPLDFAILRSAFGALTLFLLMLARRQSLAPPAGAFRMTAFLGLLQTTGFVGLVAWALLRGEAGHTAVLAYTMPFWALLFGRLFLGETLRGLQWLAVTAALAGAILMIAPWKIDWNVEGGLNSFIPLAAGLAWGASLVVAKRIHCRDRGELLSLTGWQMALGTLPLAVAALFVSQPVIEWNAYFIGALIYNAVFASAAAWLLWLFALQRLPAGTAGLASLAAPAISLVAAWLQLGERPGPVSATGMSLIFAALALLSLRALLSKDRG